MMNNTRIYLQDTDPNSVRMRTIKFTTISNAIHDELGNSDDTVHNNANNKEKE